MSLWVEKTSTSGTNDTLMTLKFKLWVAEAKHPRIRADSFWRPTGFNPISISCCSIHDPIIIKCQPLAIALASELQNSQIYIHIQPSGNRSPPWFEHDHHQWSMIIRLDSQNHYQQKPQKTRPRRKSWMEGDWMSIDNCHEYQTSASWWWCPIMTHEYHWQWRSHKWRGLMSHRPHSNCMEHQTPDF